MNVKAAKIPERYTIYMKWIKLLTSMHVCGIINRTVPFHVHANGIWLKYMARASIWLTELQYLLFVCINYLSMTASFVIDFSKNVQLFEAGPYAVNNDQQQQQKIIFHRWHVHVCCEWWKFKWFGALCFNVTLVSCFFVGQARPMWKRSKER